VTSPPPGAPAALPPGAETYQSLFERRWPHLLNPHVRALAWLLDAPDLLDPASPHWHGRIASLGAMPQETAEWLAALEQDPIPLESALGTRHYSRLGLYAEKLMAFYFAEHGKLVVHGLQVRANRNDTVGEFDFLLRDGDDLVHIEFATKFYLLDADAAGASFNGLIGPNLADTLGAKMRKIFDKQLSLARHPAAQALLPQPVARAQALVKGWLFYPDSNGAAVMEGISQPHCNGFWMTLSEAQDLPDGRYVVMPRLHWLAPLKSPSGADMSKQELLAALAGHMAQISAPVMAAAMRPEGEWLVEQRRGFIVPDDWHAQAAQRRQDGTLPA
jgi:hypothetical protein